MNYYPYFRGKQYELICLRENAELVSRNGFTPIIEPVKEAVNGVRRALEALKVADASFLVVANPSVGFYAGMLSDDFIAQIDGVVDGYRKGGWIFQVDEAHGFDQFNVWLQRLPNLAILHKGLASAKGLVGLLAVNPVESRVHVFGENCSTRYRAAFDSDAKALLVDGFKKRKNADFPEVELFSEMPVTYGGHGVNGFGDYLIAGSEYSEGGGAAYAVAIHLTYADAEEDGVIYIRHFVSDTNGTPTDPAGKFKEAVAKLVAYCGSPDSKIPLTNAVVEFGKLHQSGHFPGLGYVKKLSMQHHLEIMGG